MQSAYHRSSSNERPRTVRDDGECGKPAAPKLQHYQSHRNEMQSQQEDKWTCPCGGSCSDELSRLESRLAAMESRLADFEALIHRSCQSQSSNWQPDPTLATGRGSNGTSDGLDEPNPPPACTPPADATSSAVAPTDTAAPVSTQGGDENGTLLNLIFSDDNDTCSTAWTDMGSKHQNLVDEDQATQQPEEQLELEQTLHPKDDKLSVFSCTDSFDLIRYSTQETFVHQQRDLRLDIDTDAADFVQNDAAYFPSPTGGEPQPLTSCVRHASNSLLTTTMSHAERLLTPAGEYGSSRSCLEPGPPREMAGPPASVSRDWDQQPLACCRLLPTEAGAAAVGAITASAVVCPHGGDATCETATANCAVNLVLKSRVTHVRGGVGGGGAGGGSGAAENGCVPRDPPMSFVCVDDRGGNGVEDLGTMSTGEQTTASVSRYAPFAAQRHHLTTFQAERSRSGNNSSGNNKQDCRLCSDLVPYAHRRLGELERDGVRCLGLTALSPGKQIGCDGGSGNVCIQRSGFCKLDTVLIAGLVLKAAGLHESEGDQAGFVRLALRRMGFECAVVIGRHFTGCICSLDSSRLLVDIGEKSCLIFSFFQPASDFSQLSSAK